MYNELREARKKHASKIEEAASWERYVSCRPLPDPRNMVDMNDYVLAMRTQTVESVQLSMKHMEDAASVIFEVETVSNTARMHDDDEAVAVLAKHFTALNGVITKLADEMTAWFLHHSDYFADAETNVKNEQSKDGIKWGAWLNINKNPRLKQVDFPSINVHMDIQKQLALAPIAIRVQVRSTTCLFSPTHQIENPDNQSLLLQK